MQLVGVHSMKKNILDYPNLWKHDNTFIHEMIKANPRNEILRNNLYKWLIEEWNI